MHSVFPFQRPRSDAPRHHGAASHRERLRAQSHPAAAAGGVSIAPRRDLQRLGRGAEPASAGGHDSFRDAGAGSATPLSERATTPHTGGAFFAASGRVSGISSTMRSILLGLIRFYQACLSPAIPSSCRFYPSCSAYAYEAVEKWGLRRGVKLAAQRLVRCRPFGGRGYDPVP